jgi:hypothetical protein
MRAAPLVALLSLLPFASVGDIEAKDLKDTVNGEPTHLVASEDVAAAEALLAVAGVRNGTVHVISNSPSTKPNEEVGAAPADRGPLTPFEERRRHPARVEETGPSASLDHMEEEMKRRTRGGLLPEPTPSRQLTDEEKETLRRLLREMLTHHRGDNMITCFYDRF